jgi:hypothetical protein
MTEVRITYILGAQAEAISIGLQFSGVVMHRGNMGKTVSDFASVRKKNEPELIYA